MVRFVFHVIELVSHLDKGSLIVDFKSLAVKQITSILMMFMVVVLMMVMMLSSRLLYNRSRCPISD